MAARPHSPGRGGRDPLQTGRRGVRAGLYPCGGDRRLVSGGGGARLGHHEPRQQYFEEHPDLYRPAGDDSGRSGPGILHEAVVGQEAAGKGGQRPLPGAVV